LANLGVKRALVVHGQDGLDEISISAPTSVVEMRNGWFQRYEMTPEEFGLQRWSKDDVVGGTPQENAVIAREILGGQPGAKRDAVLLNSAAGIYLAKDGVTIADAVGMAADAIDSGKALRQLERFAELSNKAAA